MHDFYRPDCYSIISFAIKGKVAIIYNQQNNTFNFTAAIYHKAANALVPLNEVLGIGVSIEKPIGYPVLDIRSIKLSNEEFEKNTVFSSIRP